MSFCVYLVARGPHLDVLRKAVQHEQETEHSCARAYVCVWGAEGRGGPRGAMLRSHVDMHAAGCEWFALRGLLFGL